MQTINDLCCFYLACLRSLYLLEKNLHWTTKGLNFYGNHLLFDRLAESALKDSDAVAERLIGVFNEECADLTMQAAAIKHQLEKYAPISDPIECALKAEQDFIELSDHLYQTLKAEEKLTLGLDDLIMEVCSRREEACYLLKQASTARALDATNSVQARIKFFGGLIKNTVNSNS